MKSFKDYQINEEDQLNEVDVKKFDTLVRTGLTNRKDLQRLHIVLKKIENTDNPNLSRQERMLLVNLSNRMLGLMTTNKGLFQKTRQVVGEEFDSEALDESHSSEFKNLPPILVLKRKAIRLFPNGLKVATYYSDKLNRTFTLPMNDLSMGSVTEEVQPTIQAGIIKTLREITKGKAANTIKFKDGKKMKVDMYTAKAVLALYDAVDADNKAKLDQLMNKDKNGFIKVADYAFSKAKK